MKRTVKNVESKAETYLCAALPPNGTVVNLYPPSFTIAPQETQDLYIQFNATEVIGEFSFGEVVLTGSLNHVVRIPLLIFPVSVS